MPKHRPVEGEIWRWHPQATMLPSSPQQDYLLEKLYWKDNFYWATLKVRGGLSPHECSHYRVKALIESPDWECIEEIPVYRCAKCHKEVDPSLDPDYLCKRCRSQQERAA